VAAKGPGRDTQPGKPGAHTVAQARTDSAQVTEGNFTTLHQNPFWKRLVNEHRSTSIGMTVCTASNRHHAENIAQYLLLPSVGRLGS
jgi:hypothetical protein